MSRRIFAAVFMFSILLIASFFFSHQNVLALTPTISATPTAAPADFVGTPLSGTAPLTVQFTDISHTLITACTWNYGDGIGLTVDPTGTPFTACPSLPHTYTSTGSFTVTMRLFKADGTSVTVTKTNYVQVSDAVLTPTRTFTPTPPGDITVTGSVHTFVTDMGIPVAGAQVKAAIGVGRVITATTAADGSYSLFLPAPYIIGYSATFTVSAPGYVTYTATYSEAALRANPVVYFTLVATGQPTATVTLSPTITRTPTRTATGPTPTITRMPTRTNTPAVTNTPTRTPTPITGVPCNPVSSSITAPFTFDGTGTFCWQSTNLGAYINSWNTASVTLNGVNITNVYVAVASYPAKIGGYWYVGYSSSVAWGHFEAK